MKDFAPLTLGEPLPSHVINPTSNAYPGNDTGNTTLVNLLLREFGQINEKRRLQGSFFLKALFYEAGYYSVWRRPDGVIV